MAKTSVRSLALAVAIRSCFGQSPCPPGSVPYFNCDFSAAATGPRACWAGVNLGEASPMNSNCAVPSPQNGCYLAPQADLSWLWKAKPGFLTPCCNCMQLKSASGGSGSGGNVCPDTSLSEDACGFGGYSGGTCFKGVNTGQLAHPQNSDQCQVPSPENGCRLEADEQSKVYYWRSTQKNVKCCNCWLKVRPKSGRGNSNGGYLAQTEAEMVEPISAEPRGGDEASMLQMAAAKKAADTDSFGGDPCQRGSVPFFKCKTFSPDGSGPGVCIGGVNYGQAAMAGGGCSVPSPSNLCHLQAQPDLSWLWKSPSVTCCNCFLEKSHNNNNIGVGGGGSGYCQSNSLPKDQCNFDDSSSRWNSCYKAANTGQTATKNSECQAPSVSNGCRLVPDKVTYIYSWVSSNPGVRCCNCYLKRDFMNGGNNNGGGYNSGGHNNAGNNNAGNNNGGYNNGGYDGGGYNSGGYGGDYGSNQQQTGANGGWGDYSSPSRRRDWFGWVQQNSKTRAHQTSDAADETSMLQVPSEL